MVQAVILEFCVQTRVVLTVVRHDHAAFVKAPAIVERSPQAATQQRPRNNRDQSSQRVVAPAYVITAHLT